jgi:hypothetical protein
VNIKHYDYRPRGAARDLFRHREDEVVMSGPAGTGKSRAILERMNAVAEKYAGSRQLLVRKTRSSLTNTGIVTFQQIVLPPGNANVTYQQAEYPNGSIIDFGGMDKASKIMSSEYDIIVAQEGTELTENDWESLSTRLRWGRVPYQQLLADVNPGAPTHWMKQREKRHSLVMLESRHEDNPYLWDTYDSKNEQHGATPWEGFGWTPKGRAYIAKLDALTGVRYDRLRLGKWSAAEGSVYDEWNPDIHLIDRFDIPRGWPRVWTVDFGYTNPFVWQAWAYDGDGRLFRYREIYRTQRITEDHAKDILKACHGEPYPVAIVCDHDAEDRATLERHLGMRTMPAFKSISPGIQAVQRRLRKAGDNKPRLMLMRDSLVSVDQDLVESKKPTCTEEEIEGYVWPQGGIHSDVPVKKDDHAMDAMRYLVALVDDVGIDPSAKTSRTVTYNQQPQYPVI